MSHNKAAALLRKHALGYPESIEDFPWGHSAYKVQGKIFLSVYLDDDEGVLSLSVKLPISNKLALTLPFAAPTRYGLGKHGWVTATFNVGADAPLDMIQEWVDESFRAVAPKRIVAQLEGTPAKPTRHKKTK